MTKEPKLWRDMTPEEKGALLLARYEGKQIEVASPQCYVWFPAKSTWFNELAYRIKPEPKRETVTLTSWGTLNQWLRDGDLSKVHKDNRKYKITFDTIDGKPDPSSINIEEL